MRDQICASDLCMSYSPASGGSRVGLRDSRRTMSLITAARTLWCDVRHDTWSRYDHQCAAMALKAFLACFADPDFLDPFRLQDLLRSQATCWIRVEGRVDDVSTFGLRSVSLY
jgi:hypothetical protein